MELSLHYDFTKTGSLTPINGQGPEVPMIRASDAPIIDRNGWIKQVTDGVPRMYGALFNNNIFLKSEDQEDVVWNSGGSGVVRTGGQLDPWGTFKATELRDDARGGSFVARIQQEFTHDGNAAYLIGMHVAPGNNDWVVLNVQNTGGTPSSISSFFDVANNKFGTLAGSNSGFIDRGMVKFANGFYFCYVVVQFEGGDGSSTFLCQVADGDGDSSLIMDGSNSIVVVGAIAHEVSGNWLRQNLFLYADDLSQTNWGTLNATKTPNAAIAPDDTQTALRLTGNAGLGAHRIGQARDPLSSSNIYSWYVKYEDWQYVQLINGNDGNYYGNFDILNGLTGNQGSSVSGLTIERAKNGYFRISVLQDNGVYDTSVNWYLYFVDSLTSSYAQSTAGGASVLLWHPQLEVKKPNQTAPGAFIGQSERPLVQSVAAYQFRVPNYLPTDTDPVSKVTGPCDGYLPETDATNVVTYSEDISQSVWQTIFAAKATNVDFAPNGAKSMARITDNNDAGSGIAYIQHGLSLATSTVYTFSFYAKADQSDFVYFNWGDTPAAGIVQFFNLANGTVGTNQNSPIYARIKPCGNGVYRCSVTLQTDAVDAAGTFQIGIAASDGVQIITRNGNNSVDVWGMQCVAGRIALGYTPTNGATATKAYDNSNSTEIGWWNTTGEGTWYVRADVSEYRGTFGGEDPCPVCMSFNSGVFMRIGSQVNTADQCNIWISGGASIGLANGGAPGDAGTEFQFATGFAIDDLATALNGVEGGSDTDADTAGWSTPTTLSIGNNSAGVIHSALIKEIRYYRGTSQPRLANEFLVKMTQTPPIFPGYDPARKKKAAIDAALWNKAMNARTREANSDGDFTPFNNVG